MPAVTGTTSNGKTTGSQTSLTFAHTATGDDLYVAIGYFSGQAATVTYGGVALQLLGRVVSGQSIEWWYLPAVTAGTANVVITPTASSWIAAVARNISGADRDGVFRNLNSAAATSTAPSVVITSAVGDLVLDLVICDVSNQVFTVGAGQTANATQNSLVNTDTKAAASQEAGAASVTMSWTLSVSDNWLIAGLSIPADGTIPPNAIRVSQDAIETLSQPILPAARVSQAVLELLSESAASGVAGSGGVTLSHPLLDGTGTASLPAGSGAVTISHPLLDGTGHVLALATRTTQQAVEVFLARSAPATRTTQLAVEVFHPIVVPIRATQLPVEVFNAKTAAVRTTQEAVEVFLVPRPRRLIRRLRRAPHVHDEHRRIAYAKFALDLQRGVGALMGQGATPVVTLRVSRDGGQTWSEPVTMRAGTLGAFTTRVLARRLGHARDAVFEVTVSDPVAWSLVQAWLDLEPGTS